MRILILEDVKTTHEGLQAIISSMVSSDGNPIELVIATSVDGGLEALMKNGRFAFIFSDWSLGGTSPEYWAVNVLEEADINQERIVILSADSAHFISKVLARHNIFLEPEEQIFHKDEDGLVAAMEYMADVLGLEIPDRTYKDMETKNIFPPL